MKFGSANGDSAGFAATAGAIRASTIWAGSKPREDGKAGAGNKPGSVEGNHSSGTAVTGRLVQPTREPARDRRIHSPIWSCSGRGLPCRELLPVARCALTAPFHPYRPTRTPVGGLFSVALSVGSRPPGVTWRPVRRSPDFPLRRTAAIVWPTPALSVGGVYSKQPA